MTPFEEPTPTPFVTPTPTPEAFPPASPMPTLTPAPQAPAPEQPATPVAAARVNQGDRRESERGQEPVQSQPLRRVEGTRPGVVRLLAFGLVGIVSAVVLGAISLKLWQRQP